MYAIVLGYTIFLRSKLPRLGGSVTGISISTRNKYFQTGLTQFIVGAIEADAAETETTSAEKVDETIPAFAESRCQEIRNPETGQIRKKAFFGSFNFDLLQNFQG